MGDVRVRGVVAGLRMATTEDVGSSSSDHSLDRVIFTEIDKPGFQDVIFLNRITQRFQKVPLCRSAVWYGGSVYGYYGGYYFRYENQDEN